MEAKRSVVVIECRVELVRPMDTAAIDDHHDVFAGFAEGCHHLMDVLAQFLGVKMGHNFIEADIEQVRIEKKLYTLP